MVTWIEDKNLHCGTNELVVLNTEKYCMWYVCVGVCVFTHESTVFHPVPHGIHTVSSITITICTLSSTCITMADEDGNDEGKIRVNSFISFSMGDVRRPSFVVGAAERASMSFGIRNKCIFEGGICYKQCQCQLTVVYQRLGI
jgi:hypothetical protein